MIHDGGEKRDIVADALDLETVERRPHVFDRRFTGWCPSAELGDHRIVEHRDFAALVDAGVVADSVGIFGNFRRWAITREPPD